MVSKRYNKLPTKTKDLNSVSFDKILDTIKQKLHIKI
jgi:hypothetical protein